MLKLAQTGDTIVEVLIALAILGSAFGISYATANKGLIQARNAEEHSQALEYLDKQIELLHLAAGNDDAKTNGIFTMNAKAFCLKPTTPADNAKPVTVIPFTSGWIPDSKPTDQDLQNADTNYPADCVQSGPPYYLSITYTKGSNDDVFKALVRWNGIGSLGAQQESLSYKLHP